jgi:hypothetical protein
MPDVAQIRLKRSYIGFNDVSVLGDPAVDSAVIHLQAVELPQVIRDLTQRNAFEVQIKRGCHNARVITHAFKSSIEDELSRTALAFEILATILLAVFDYIR